MTFQVSECKEIPISQVDYQQIRGELDQCLSRYEEPNALLEKMRWIAYRAFNALKSIFGLSDWQMINKKILKHVEDEFGEYCESSKSAAYKIIERQLNIAFNNRKYIKSASEVDRDKARGLYKLDNFRPIQDRVKQYTSRYIKPSGLFARVQWAMYRAFNALKSIFGQSDWQVAVALLVEAQMKDSDDKSDSFKAAVFKQEDGAMKEHLYYSNTYNSIGDSNLFNKIDKEVCDIFSQIYPGEPE